MATARHRKTKRKATKKSTGAHGLSYQELVTAAKYFSVSNMGQEPRQMSVRSIHSKFDQMNQELYYEYAGDPEFENEEDGAPSMEPEYKEWMSDLLKGPGNYAFDEWMKMRDEVEGL